MRSLPLPDDTFTITGRGTVFCYSKRLWRPPPYVGEHILVDGEEYEIKGIEQWAIMSMGKPEYWDGPREGGFLVKKVDT